jgi:hypothetical protein
MRLHHAIILSSALIPLMGADGGCGGPILDNNGFDLWCGDQLCFWEIEDGSVEQIPTWHEGDLGVDLVGNSVALSQAARTTAECLRVSAVADVEETAEVTVEIDFFDSGTADIIERIPTTSWEPISLLITPPVHSQGARFRIRKLGAGRAQLAELGIEEADKCTAPPVEIGPRPLGATCRDNADCESDTCLIVFPDFPEFGGVCAGCIDSAGCADGEICGVETPESLIISSRVDCTAPGIDPVGAKCRDGAECISGICNAAGECSDCLSASDCGGAACVPNQVWEPGDFDTGQSILGYVCDASLEAGASCSFDASCASGACAGEPLRMCESSNRECVDDTDCYKDAACVTVGASGGVCQ